MKKLLLMLIVSIAAIGTSMAEKATATFRAAKGENIQVIINNKIINHQPKSMVKVQGYGGEHDVKIKVYTDSKVILVKDEIEMLAGYKNDFMILELNEQRMTLKKTGVSRMYDNRYRRPDNFYNKRYYASLLSNNEMNAVLNKLNNANSDKNKLMIATSTIKDKKVTAGDVGEIMNALVLEDSKLKFAKWAYKRTLDKENYDLLNGGFQFRTSIIELERYITTYNA